MSSLNILTMPNLTRVKLIITAYLLLAISPLLAQDDATLINITTLAQLNAIRYDLDGDGTPTGDAATLAAYRTAFDLAANVNNVCTNSGATVACVGYELMANLDFKQGAGTTAGYSIWAEGSTATGMVAAGWVPIGDNTNPFAAIFEGNGHTILNLFIDRSSVDYVGLFGYLKSGEARNLGLEGGSVTGGENTGALAGSSDGATVRACYATGGASGKNVGGLVGRNKGLIRTSYATGSVTGTGDGARVGGLVGLNDGSSSEVIACYSMAVVSGGSGDNAHTGGFMGRNYQGTVSACYSASVLTRGTGTGAATGGLMGSSNSGSVSNSYFALSPGLDVISSLQNSPTLTNVSSEASSALQMPAGYSGLYADWNVDVDGTSGADDPWTFGTDKHYPKLRVDFDNDASATAAEFGAQLLILTSFTPPSTTSDAAEGALFLADNEATAGTTVGMLSAANAAGGTAPTLTLITEGVFILEGTSLKVKTGATLDYNTTSRYLLSFQLTLGDITARRPAVVHVKGPNDTDSDGLIEIRTLAQLNAMRYDLNGDGVVDDDVDATGMEAYEMAFGSASACEPGACQDYELMNDLDFNDTDGSGTLSKWAKECTTGCETGTLADGTTGNTGWDPIGDNSLINSGDNPLDPASPRRRFTATFEGNDHTISNLYINRRNAENIYGGLFGYIEGASISNVGMENVDVSATSARFANAGGLVGYIIDNCSISSCYATGDVTATTSGENRRAHAGGLVGLVAKSSVSSSHATGDVTATSSGDSRAYAGGLVGGVLNNGSISSSHATGDVTATSSGAFSDDIALAGGLVGDLSGLVGDIRGNSSISSCYATGDVTATGSGDNNAYAAGLVGGVSDSSISDSYATGNASSTGSLTSYKNAGGLVGYLYESSINSSYATGNAVGSVGSSAEVGGLVGAADLSSISSCYATGDASASTSSDPALARAGGLVGFLYESSISSCYATGDVTATSSGNEGSAGGLVGNIFTISTITASYYTTEATITITNIGGGGTNTGNTIGAAYPIATLIAATDYDYDHDRDPVTDALYPATSWNIDVDNADKDDDPATGVDNPWDFGTATQYPKLKDASAEVDYDTDNDGLIEITTLEQLFAIRYDLDGNGAVISGDQTGYGAAFPTTNVGSTYGAISCGTSGSPVTCTGYELMNNLDFAGSRWENPTGGTFGGTREAGGWVPIGKRFNGFEGIFDGNEHTISNIFINRPTLGNVALFGYAVDSEIRNLGIVGGSVTGLDRGIGALAGTLFRTTIESCYATSTISTKGGHSAQLGGLIGSLSTGILRDCYATGNVSAGEEKGLSAGGLAGVVEGATVRDCYATGNVTITENVMVIEDPVYAGGLVGSSAATVTACYATGNVEATGETAYVGGLIGTNGGHIRASYSIGNAVARGKLSASAGGLIGVNGGGIGGVVIACYATGNAKILTEGNAGGLIGENWGAIVACYAAGVVTGTGTSTGGLLGWNRGATSGTGTATVLNSYFDSSVNTGLSDAIGDSAGSVSEINVVGKTTSELQMPMAYGSGSDIYSTWNIDLDNEDSDNDRTTDVDDPWDFGTDKRYPKLKANWDRNDATPPTAVEFGAPQRFIFTDASDVEVISFSVEENSAPGTLGNIKDLVSGSGSTFALSGSSSELAVTSGGAISTSMAIDYEVLSTEQQNHGILLAIEVTDGSNSFTRTTSVEIIDLNDVSDRPPTFDRTNYVFEIPEDAAVGDVVMPSSGYFVLDATDRDGDDVSFSASSTIFSVADDGTITVAAPGVLDYETTSSYTLEVTVSSTGSSSTELSATKEVAINLIDVDEGSGNLELMITNIDPESGAVGESVTITGTGFSTTASVVTFLGDIDDQSDNVQAVVATTPAATATSLVVVVPQDAVTGPISVMVDAVADTSSVSFRVVTAPVALEITSIAPESGAVGDQVTITGTGFSTTASVVTFLGDIDDQSDNVQAVVATTPAATEMSLVVAVPQDAVTGPISVMVDAVADTSTVFTISDAPTLLTITSIAPESGAVGDQVTITGTGFSTTASVVTFLGDIDDQSDNVQAVVATTPAATEMSLVVAVPQDAVTGPISVMVDAVADTSTVFTIVTAPVALEITSIAPESGAVGDQVTITGTGFSTTASVVTFLGDIDDQSDNVQAVIATTPSPTATSLVVVVPQDAVTGTISVMVDAVADTSTVYLRLLCKEMGFLA